MESASLFQLGIGLATGTQAENFDSGQHVVRPQDSHYSKPNLELVCNSSRDDHFVRRDGKVFAGTHLIIEVVNGRGLDDEARIQRAFRDCVSACGATLLHIHTHKFSPQGVSGVAVLSESHISVHTWPEIGYAAFDVFMCGNAQPWKSVAVLAEIFDTKDVRVREFLRGEDVVAAYL